MTTFWTRLTRLLVSIISRVHTSVFDQVDCLMQILMNRCVVSVEMVAAVNDAWMGWTLV